MHGLISLGYSQSQTSQIRNVIFNSLLPYEIIQKDNSPMPIDETWKLCLRDFIVTKSIEGKSKRTLKFYTSELRKLLSYFNKPIKDISTDDIG